MNETVGSTTRSVASTLLRPMAGWPRITTANLRGDLGAAATGAVIAIPQAIALAALAGLPPQYGIYTSIFPVIIAVLWGASWFLASGPNTAVSLMLAAAAASIVSNSSTLEYFELILMLSIMVGAIQLMAGLLRAGSTLDFVSNTVIVAITFAVAMVMIVSAIASMLDLPPVSGINFFEKAWRVIRHLSDADPWTAGVGGVALGAGLLARLVLKRHALLVALLGGGLAAFALQKYGGDSVTRVSLLGTVPLSIPDWSLPPFDGRVVGVAGELINSAAAIAFVGLMQSVVIARSLAVKSGRPVDANRECVGQGMANLLAPFFSAFAGSGSFNRSAAHYALGARTPYAMIYSVLLLLVLVLIAQPLLALIPHAAVSATLILVGFALLDWGALKRLWLSREEVIIFLAVLLTSLGFGLTGGVLTGVVLSLVIYLGKTSIPRLHQWSFVARDGRDVTAVGIDGNLFFGSAPQVEQLLPPPPVADDDPHILIFDTRHITYLDRAGAELLLRYAQRWREQASQAYIKLDRSELLPCFEQTGLLSLVGEDCLIRPDRHHLMKNILDFRSHHSQQQNDQREEEFTVHELAQRLHSLALLGPIPFNRLLAMLEDLPIYSAHSNDIVVRADEALDDHLVLLEGEMEVQRTWSTPDSYDKSYTWVLKPEGSEGGPSILTAASRRLRARALTDIRYMRLDANTIDEMLGWNWSATEDPAAGDDTARERMSLVRQVGIFHHIPLERVQEAFRRMRPCYFSAGEIVIREGERGDRYFVIEEGEAEVIRTDPFTDESRTTDYMGAGDGFGEESLLQDGFRNATIRMLTPGKLLALTRDDFEQLIRPSMVEEIDAEHAQGLLQQGEVQLLDCRYDLEYEESRIPGAKLIPLHELRFQAQELDSDARYIVYCRSGRRSKAAAFLLKERNFIAVSLKGGIKEWPYEVDASPL